MAPLTPSKIALYALASALLAAVPLLSQAPQMLGGKPCLTLAEASKPPGANPYIEKDICVAAHIYDFVELPDGTRFLDVCPPEVSDDQCHFTLLSLPADRRDVGDLTQLRGQDIAVRGVLRATYGRMGMVISHQRQFRGGPEKFRPNPRLLQGFNAESNRPPVHDPNLTPQGHHRSFMNNRDREQLPPPKPH